MNFPEAYKVLRNLFLSLAILCTAAAHAQDDFSTWLAGFEQEANAAGISQATLDAVLTDIQPVQQAINHDRSQPEFVQTFSSYWQHHVTPRQIRRGIKALKQHRALLAKVEKRYGIPQSVLVAFWGMETNYGTRMGNFSIPAALATLAFEGRRHEFFRDQLLDALRIVQAGHMSAQGMHGSWAGAMGHMQFMPSTFLAYAVDGDGNSRINLVTSLTDAMYSAGNYLKDAGWRKGEPIALEVQLPAQFDWEQAQLMRRLPLADWIAAGVKPVGAHAFPKVAGTAAIILPQGWRGPAFMVFDNFDVVMQWNRSINYALSVAGLANQLRGQAGWTLPQDAEQTAVNFQQMRTLQQELSELGFAAGEADGMPGMTTQSAIRHYQKTHALAADGYASPNLAAHVAQSYTQFNAARLSKEQPALDAPVTSQ